MWGPFAGLAAVAAAAPWLHNSRRAAPFSRKYAVGSGSAHGVLQAEGEPQLMRVLQPTAPKNVLGFYKAIVHFNLQIADVEQFALEQPAL